MTVFYVVPPIPPIVSTTNTNIITLYKEMLFEVEYCFNFASSLAIAYNFVQTKG